MIGLVAALRLVHSIHAHNSTTCTTCCFDVQVCFHDGEVLSWNKVPTTINNLILGKIYVDFAGTMKVCSNLHSNEMRVKFKDTGSMFGASKRTLSGTSFEGGMERPGFRCDPHLSPLHTWCLYHVGILCSVHFKRVRLRRL